MLICTSVRGLFVEAKASSFPPVPLGKGTLDMSQLFPLFIYGKLLENKVASNESSRFA
jgi:hypothetical protein